MWTLILIVYVGSVNDAEIGTLRKFTTEQACEIAAEMAQKKIRRGFRLTAICVPVSP